MKVFLLLGSNVDGRLDNLSAGRKSISERIAPLEEESSIYETAPWGNENQTAFLNQAVLIETQMQPEALLEMLKSVEREIGRKQNEKWGPRLIDIDILMTGDVIYQSDKLTVPHPRLQDRRFALTPLAEFAADVVHPVFRKTVRELLHECKDELEVKLFSPSSKISRSTPLIS